ncbi:MULTISPECIES: hypothetical protein [unclassified Microbacterium]|uniref:hypothetical protein n=1 Tax=unclassified Microbacterium TaxID=2609290 RepID=UPI0036542645
MRILTVRQPWAWAIVHGGKDVENRKTNIAGDYRGPVAILAARADAENASEDVWKDHADFYRKYYRMRGIVGRTPTLRGHIIGVVDLVDVHPVANPHFHPICYDLADPNGLLTAAARGDGACSRWAHPEGRWHLVLENPRPLAEPIPYRGALGLRALDAEMVALVEAAIA